MALLSLGAGLALLLANLWLYRRQRLRYPAMQRERPAYPAGFVTRLFRVAKVPFYLALALQLVLETFVWRPGGPRPVLLGAGTLLGAAGLLLLYRGLEALGSEFAPCDRAVLPSVRVRTGPYRWLDHPIYAGNLLLFAGVAVLAPGPIAFLCLAFIAVVYAASIRDEKRALRRHFGEGGAPERLRTP